MDRIGLTTDELVVHWSRPPRRYAARIEGLNVLEGETVALVGEGAGEVAAELYQRLACVQRIDGAAAARAGVLRVAAQDARAAGARALVVSDPLAAATPEARSLAVADLAGVASLGLTTVVVTDDVELAALFADRVAVVTGGRVVVAYPVIAKAPRTPADVTPVADRVRSRLAAAGTAA